MPSGFEVTTSANTHAGRHRPNNQDYVAFFEPGNLEELLSSGRLYIVADGVGGASQGERASKYAAEKVLVEYYHFPEVESGERLQRIMRQAGNEIYNYAAQSIDSSRMATTIVAAVVTEKTLILANVGDSRGYIIRDGAVHQITTDHTELNEMIKDGRLTEEEARRTTGKNRVTRSLGGELNVQVDIFGDIPLKEGDKILLCSDGLTKHTSNDNLVELTKEGTPQMITKRLIDYANQKGGVDNISVIIVSIGKEIDLADTQQEKANHLISTPVSLEDMPTETFFEEKHQQESTMQRRHQKTQKKGYPLYVHIILFVGVISLCSIIGVLTRIVINL